ncbi:MAG: hypothetical protein ACHQD8_06320 [Chitinophagales bacterium]
MPYLSVGRLATGGEFPARVSLDVAEFLSFPFFVPRPRKKWEPAYRLPAGRQGRQVGYFGLVKIAEMLYCGYY